MAAKLTLATWNVHKGFSPLGRRLTVHALRDRLRELSADVVFLQEVQGEHRGHAARHRGWPEKPQHEFFAEDVWDHAAYGKNPVYEHGHHGNAILSRFPIVHRHNQDVTTFRWERRGLLHCGLDVPGAGPVHCVCVHLSLFARSRRRQMAALVDHLDRAVPKDAPLVVAGDFNDWRNDAERHLAARLGLSEVFTALERAPTRSFPAVLPVLRLDRVYQRGLVPRRAVAHAGGPWAGLSDHAALSVELEVPG